jgi:hypothetical protein
MEYPPARAGDQIDDSTTSPSPPLPVCRQVGKEF